MLVLATVEATVAVKGVTRAQHYLLLLYDLGNLCEVCHLAAHKLILSFLEVTCSPSMPAIDSLYKSGSLLDLLIAPLDAKHSPVLL